MVHSKTAASHQSYCCTANYMWSKLNSTTFFITHVLQHLKGNDDGKLVQKTNFLYNDINKHHAMVCRGCSIEQRIRFQWPHNLGSDNFQRSRG